MAKFRVGIIGHTGRGNYGHSHDLVWAQFKDRCDVVAVAAISGAPWSTTGKKAIIPKRNTPESTSILTTAARNVLFVISGADLTAGKVQVYLEVMGAR